MLLSNPGMPKHILHILQQHEVCAFATETVSCSLTLGVCVSYLFGYQLLPDIKYKDRLESGNNMS